MPPSTKQKQQVTLLRSIRTSALTIDNAKTVRWQSPPPVPLELGLIWMLPAGSLLVSRCHFAGEEGGADGVHVHCRYLVQYYAIKFLRHVRATGISVTVHDAYLALVKVSPLSCLGWSGAWWGKWDRSKDGSTRAELTRVLDLDVRAELQRGFGVVAQASHETRLLTGCGS